MCIQLFFTHLFFVFSFKYDYVKMKTVSFRDILAISQFLHTIYNEYDFLLLGTWRATS